MPGCCVPSCGNDLRRVKGKTYHQFPRDNPALLQIWITNIGRINWQPKRHTRVCSDHFTPDSFDMTGCTVRLRSGAIPTLFEFKQQISMCHHPVTDSVTVNSDGDIKPNNHIDEITAAATVEETLDEKLTELNGHYNQMVAEHKLASIRIKAVQFAQTCVESGVSLITASKTALDLFLSEATDSNSKCGQIETLRKYNDSIEAAVHQYQKQRSEAVEDYECFVNAIYNSTVDTPAKSNPIPSAVEQDQHITPCITTESHHTVATTYPEKIANKPTQDHAYDVSSKPRLKSYVTQCQDHSYCTRDSPILLKRRLAKVTDKLVESAKRRKVALQRIRRLNAVVSSLSDVVSKLQQEKMISDSATVEL